MLISTHPMTRPKRKQRSSGIGDLILIVVDLEVDLESLASYRRCIHRAFRKKATVQEAAIEQMPTR